VATSKETFISCLRNEDHEYLPMFLRDFTLGMDVTNVRTTDVFTKEYDHELSAKCVKAFRNVTEQDAVVGCVHSPAFNIEAFGGEMKYPEYGIPLPIKHPFENMNDIPEISLEPRGKALGALRSYSSVRENMPDVAVVANVEGPLTKTGTITGMEKMIMCLESENDLIDDIISVCLEHTYSFLEHLDRNGSIDSVFMASASDNPDLFGPEIYENFTIRWLKRMTDRIHKMRYPVIFHPHGTFTSPGTEKVFDDTVRTGIDGFQYAEENDPRKIVSMIGGRCSVLGGTNIVPTILNGSEKEIRDETLFHINACENADHVFMCSCSLQRATPLSNIRVMCDTVHRHNGRIV